MQFYYTNINYKSWIGIKYVTRLKCPVPTLFVCAVSFHGDTSKFSMVLKF